ncbi:hypothetical protein GCM10011352_41000 [Marinobacterium zhoushanense]|uniref:Uncharacterized protein n=1 Tax=Marinobacterium zhoushanense TaxID=1679163 RepID=A0ABQ1KTY9_9GAMM|nr:hypothetical protein [Marinobacterium zhoushanense]GGC10300.1 hypothetical protein GCM10011352_41000 [Marinobacterium zhoushanense]
MAATHNDERYEELGLIPSIAMVLVGLVIAIVPALVQLGLLLGN